MASFLILGCFPFQFSLGGGGGGVSLPVSRWAGLTSVAECYLVVEGIQLQIYLSVDVVPHDF